MRSFLSGRGGRAALVIGLLMLIGGGMAYATIPSSGGTISGCYHDGNGKLRLIDTDAGEQCKRDETSISWTQSARLACPSGTTLSTGVCIENAARAATTQPDAADVCSAEGRRLPSGGELQTFRDIPGITLAAGGEWTDDVADINRVDDATGTEFGDFSIFGVTDTGNGVIQAFDDAAYRCVAGAGIG